MRSVIKILFTKFERYLLKNQAEPYVITGKERIHQSDGTEIYLKAQYESHPRTRRFEKLVEGVVNKSIDF